jgi:hypothetical protein
MALIHVPAAVPEEPGGRSPRLRRLVRWLVGGIAAVMIVASVGTAGIASADVTSAGALAGAGQSDFGPNVKIFDPSMPIADIQAAVNAVAAQQVDDEMGTNRYALLFKPGTYGTPDHPLIFQVGYYTEVAGLGLSPNDVTINGSIDVYNRCLTPTNCLALVNFWRSMSNLTIKVSGQSGCRGNTEFWAVSQAAPMRRVKVVGNTTFMDYCTAGPQYASGGFMADSVTTGNIVNGSQQQFVVRNSAINGWSNGVWNQVFAGVQNAPAQSFPAPPYTTLPTVPVSRERPFLYVDASGDYHVFVPDLQTNSAGPTWVSGPTPGHSVALSDFFVATPSDSVQTINAELARGKNLILTPGVYDIDQSIEVKRPDTIVLGQGFPTLTAIDGAVPLRIADVKGVDIAGLMIDAGEANSPMLLQVGTEHGDEGNGKHDTASDPTVLHDVFFRIGGPHVGRATLTLQVNLDNTILDDIWAWRADHGVNGSVGWTVNTADTGLVVNGDNVTALGLFVEHYQKYNVIWNGENGTTIFFQNELPYDAPNQAAWTHDGILGWAAYKVADHVKTHQAWGVGSYIFTNVDPTIHAAHGFEVPDTPGVQMHDLLTVNLSAGTIDHVINDTGAPVSNAAIGVPSYVVSYP